MVDTTSEIGDSAFLLPLPTFVPLRYQPGSLANWSGHLPFANDLIAQHRPSILVELGTHHGESYFGMCQSVVANGVDCVCYAVDHWLGEEHAGKYGEEVFEEVNDYNQRLYKNFSYLLRTNFDDARDQFSDDSIDLLHIDGLHTYEAGLHDFQHWYSKVKPGGVILLHDVMVRHADFGIWKLWEELQGQYPETFTFHHNWGLGILRKPGSHGKPAKILELLFSADHSAGEQIRRHYVLYASYVDRLATRAHAPAEQPKPAQASLPPVAGGLETERSNVLVQIYAANDSGYKEEDSATAHAEIGHWATLTFELKAGALSGAIRFDPADMPCLVEISEFQISELSGGRLIQDLQDSDLSQLVPLDSAMHLPGSDRCLIFCFGDDPKLELQPKTDFTGPVSIRVSLRIERRMNILANMLKAASSDNSLTTSMLAADLETVKTELRTSQACRLHLAAELSQFATEKASALREKDDAIALAEKRARQSEELLSVANSRISATELALSQERERSANALQSLAQASATIRSVEHSISWRLTKPLRDAVRLFRGGVSS